MNLRSKIFQFRIVSADFTNFRDESGPGPTFDLNYDVKRVRVGLDGAIWHLDIGLQHTSYLSSKNALS
jgi:hypothetical protein